MPLPLNNYDLAHLVDDTDLSIDLKPQSPSEVINEKYSDPWPELPAEALHGLAGEIVRTIEPYTEADPVGLLVNLLTAFGNCCGLNSYFQIEQKRHYLRLFTVLVGKSANGRKGSSWSTIKHMFEQIEPEWVKERVLGGLASGEGLLHEVRDKTVVKKPIKEGRRITGYNEETIDEGIHDKRLLAIEEEFAQVLKVGSREGNTLSTIIRKLWDDGNARSMTRNNPIRVTGAHVSVIGHIVKEELLRHLNDTEQANGFGNRFMWFMVKRSKLIADPVGAPLSSLNSLISQLAERIEFGRGVGLLVRDAEAQAYWAQLYPVLSEEREGLMGAMVARGPVQVLRMAGIYALFDKSSFIRVPHLKAALAVWEYSENSVKHIFGNSLGDSFSDRILNELRLIYPEGMTETEIWGLCGRHGGRRVPNALNQLKEANLVNVSKGDSTGGRSPKVWRAAKKANYAKKVPKEAPIACERSEESPLGSTYEAMER